MNLAELRRQLVARFSQSELFDLCFDLNIDYENLPWRQKGDIARELLATCQKLGRLDQLLEACQHLRPQVPWQVIVAAGTAIPIPLVEDLPLEAGKQAPGQLRISDILVQKEDQVTVLDFRVDNIGGSDVSINRISFEALESSGGIAGGLPYSGTYDLDVSELRKGQALDLYVAQRLKPGEADRFAVRLGGQEIALQRLIWFVSLKVSLHTNFGDVSYPKPIDVTLP